MNFEQFIKWIKFKTHWWTFIQINISNWLGFPYFPFTFHYQKNKQVSTGITMKLRKFIYEYLRFSKRFVKTWTVPLSWPAPSWACPGTPWTGRAGWRCSGTWRGWAAAGWWWCCTPGYTSPPFCLCTGHSSGLHRGEKRGYKYSAKNTIQER